MFKNCSDFKKIEFEKVQMWKIFKFSKISSFRKLDKKMFYPEKCSNLKKFKCEESSKFEKVHVFKKFGLKNV
jgi:hypothetical protein